MRFAIWILFIGLLIAFASAGVLPQEDYLPPALEEEQVVAEQPVEETAALADDGYRYKTVRKLRHRRDVSELVAPVVESAVLADDGYHYRAPEPAEQLEKVANEYLPPNEEASEIKEVSEAPEVSNEYLPPAEEVAEIKEAPATTEAPVISEAPAASEVPEASEAPEPALVSNEYLPPADDSEIVEGPDETAVLADDGYHYRRVRYRRDVSEIVAPASGYLYEAPAAAEEVANVYIPPAEVKEAVAEPSEAPEVVNEYLPPVAEDKDAPEVIEAPAETAELAQDGYRYKTIRRLKYRHRRDVSEIVAPASGYLYEAPAATEEVANVYLPPAEVKEAVAEPSEAPEVVNEYLPPVAEVKEAPEVVEAPAETTELAQDGYRYKTIRRLKYRHRRDVSEIVAPASGYLYEAPAATEEVANIYLPPAEVKEAIAEPSEAPEVVNEYLPPAAEVKEAPEVVEAPSETAELAQDGYRYKTIRRLKYRHRRDVSEIAAPPSGYLYEAPAATEEVAKVYLPPAEAKEAVAEPSEAPEVASEYLPPVVEVKEAPEIVEAPAPTAELAQDGYRYKTIRRLKYRHRRDVSEIIAPASGYLYEAPAATEEVANVYLPPAEVKEAVAEPSEVPEVANDYLPPAAEVKEAPEIVEAPVPTAELAQDGYRYKTIRRLKYRHRRDVSELVGRIESAVLADDGYHYRTPEASEIVPKVSNEYLPPADVVAELKEAPETAEAPEASEASASTESPIITEVAPVATEAAPLATEAAPVATEAPTTAEEPRVLNEYLPPSEEIAELKEAPEAPEESAVLAEDGYHYKVGKRFRFRRDVSEIVAPLNGYVYEAPAAAEEVPNAYIPPAEIKEAVAEPSQAPQIENEYLPPVAEVRETPEVVEAPVETAKLANDGYRYRTIRRLKYRHRRDVSEIAAPQNAPNGYFYPSPVREAIEVPVEAPVEAPAEDSAVLADDGYRYKTVRRIRYRHRRDVSELIAPVEESAVLAEDGYHYRNPEAATKVVNEYLPPVENIAEVKEDPEVPVVPEVPEAGEVVEAAEVPEAPQVSNEYLPPSEAAPLAVEAPEESAALANDGYRYKTVRRIRYRHRRDVSELIAPVEESAVLAADGYHYKKPENELPVPNVANDYLPPVEQPVEADEVPEATDAEIVEAAPEVKEAPVSVSNEYLPPVEEAPNAPEESAALADDGYRYKTIRRIRYRHRRDVSEIVNAASNGYVYEAPAASEPVANEYLPPVEDVAEVKEASPEPAEAAPEPVETAPEVSNEYLPPADAAQPEIVETPQESAALADDGYRYKTVRRIRYRHRRDVSELVAPQEGYAYNAPVEAEPEVEYLPPAEEVAEVKEAVEAPEEPAAEDGYQYKTVRRLRYRNRV